VAQTVADLLIERLMEWSVFRIYSYPDARITGNRGLRKGDQVYDFVQVRHEEASAFISVLARKIFGRRWRLPGNQKPWRSFVTSSLSRSRSSSRTVNRREAT
jgi:hypothetical protein